MCGIHCLLSRDGLAGITPFVEQRLSCRGPDFKGTREATVGANSVKLTSTVLSLRGNELTKQPFFDHASGSIFCWNGEAWRIGGKAVEGNDGAAIFARLLAASKGDGDDSQEAVIEMLRSIEGPFAFVFLDRSSEKLYYGRDRLGRRSLLHCQDAVSGDFILCSMPDQSDNAWVEVTAYSIHVFDLKAQSTLPVDGQSAWLSTPHSWSADSDELQISGIGPFNMASAATETILSLQSAAVGQLRAHLTESLRFRVRDIPMSPPRQSDLAADARLAVLFSGGLDCSVLARLAHELVPVEQAIDLLNVAFQNPRVAANRKANAADLGDDIYEACPDRITGSQSFAELVRVCKDRTWRFVAVCLNLAATRGTRAEMHDRSMYLTVILSIIARR
jgi:asparagine synthetase B (glutamine-hydrolysing)